jgi:AmmeMemoRadiSam system protein B
MSTRVRPAAVAGSFYTDDPGDLALEVDRYVHVTPPLVPRPKALILPHAGLRYSGPVAGTGYATLCALAGTVQRVVLLGPAHRAPVRGLALSSAEGFGTPLGVVRIDTEARDVALTLPGVAIDDLAHRDEHSLEVHLPFLQRVLGDFSVVPIVVGHAPAAMVADVLDALWGGDETLIVVSSDWSHYLPYDAAAVHDRETARMIVAGRLERLGPSDACGCYPVRGLLEMVCRKHLIVRLLDLRSSGDTAGPRDRVVGYGSFAVSTS